MYQVLPKPILQQPAIRVSVYSIFYAEIAGKMGRGFHNAYIPAIRSAGDGEKFTGIESVLS
jgi:hypothetical protein